MNSKLVEIVKFIPTIKLDLRYGTQNNVTGIVLYKDSRAFIEKAACVALLKVQEQLAKSGYGLVIWDAYRPLSTTKLLWEMAPVENRELTFADPVFGSIHNRGCAIDATLYDLKTKKELSMPSDFDNSTEKARPNYRKLPKETIQRREVLRAAFEANGFLVDRHEWWHYNWQNWESVPNSSFIEA